MIGQIIIEKEIEIPLERGWESPEVYSMGENGVLFAYRKDSYDKVKENWILRKYSAGLTRIREISIIIKRKQYQYHTIVDDCLYILFSSRITGKYEVVVVDLQKFELKQKKFVNAYTSYDQYKEVIVSKSTMILRSAFAIKGINIKTGKEFYLRPDLKYKPNFAKGAQVQGINILDDKKEIVVFRHVKEDDNTYEMMEKYDMDGNFIDAYNLTKALEERGDKQTKMKSFNCISMGNGKYFVSSLSNNDICYMTMTWGNIESYAYRPSGGTEFSRNRTPDKLITHAPIPFNDGQLIIFEKRMALSSPAYHENGVPKGYANHKGVYNDLWMVLYYSNDGIIEWVKSAQMYVKYDPYVRVPVSTENIPEHKFVTISVDDARKEFTLFVPSGSRIYSVTFSKTGEKINENMAVDKYDIPEISGREGYVGSWGVTPWYDRNFLSTRVEKIKNKESVNYRKKVFKIVKIRVL
jgi:hypothetical protein